MRPLREERIVNRAHEKGGSCRIPDAVAGGLCVPPNECGTCFHEISGVGEHGHRLTERVMIGVHGNDAAAGRGLVINYHVLRNHRPLSVQGHIGNSHDKRGTRGIDNPGAGGIGVPAGEHVSTLDKCACIGEHDHGRAG